jgi:hypothetical protein
MKCYFAPEVVPLVVPVLGAIGLAGFMAGRSFKSRFDIRVRKKESFRKENDHQYDQ